MYVVESVGTCEPDPMASAFLFFLFSASYFPPSTALRHADAASQADNMSAAGFGGRRKGGWCWMVGLRPPHSLCSGGAASCRGENSSWRIRKEEEDESSAFLTCTRQREAVK